ncbi:hypothetical protein IV203_001558 [Nitzschia inconspicua]|uniref:Uncharacterized protein n=1 Tax=Nitzschia inconspicua TaxID=303405 RepID=A0A9K3L8T2_9STRA|nr:hypothetical protein IV203_001558 [Nitzschia inconspicua]
MSRFLISTRAQRHASQSMILEAQSFQTGSSNAMFGRKAIKKKRWNEIGVMCIIFYALFYSWILRQRSLYEAVRRGASTQPFHTKLFEEHNNSTRSTNQKRHNVVERPEDHQHLQFSKINDTPTLNFHQKSLDILRQSKQRNTAIRIKHPPEKHPLGLQFIHPKELRQRDFFSDSWLINRQRFLEIDESRIGIVEDAAFAAVGDRAWEPHSYSKMLYDWNDFCVEHLSKWWGVLQVLRGGDPGHIFDHIIGMLERYMTERVRPPPNVSSSNSSPLGKTIGMIAFAPYKTRIQKHDPDGAKGRKLTAYSLAATIASLYQVGFGRVVVVGVNDHDMSHVQDAVNILLPIFDGQKAPSEKNHGHDQTYLVRLGTSNMEIAFVQVTDPRWISNGKVERNIPRAAIIGMRLAMNRKLNSTETSKWLGSHNNAWQYWDNIYLTEPDTILHIRRELLTKFGEALREGLSLFPHRLHPLPHESDLPTNHSLNPGLYLPDVGHFANIVTITTSTNTEKPDALDESRSDYASCCDDGHAWPGDDGWERKDGCRPWWTCGFHRIRFDRGEKFNQTALLEKHERLQLYPMMRLHNGIGAVFASTNHGRRCFPSKSQCIQ